MDIEYLLILQGLREAAGPVAEQFFLFVSNVLATAVLVAIPFVIYWCVDKRRGLLVIASFSVSALVNNLVKCIACVPRPWVRDPRVTPSPQALPGATGYSFPSGHTQNAMGVYGAAGWAFRDRGWMAPVLGGALVALIAFSRTFLGVHTPQDVLVAILEAAVVIALMERAVPWLEAADDAQATRVLVGGIIVAVASMLFSFLKPYPPNDADPASFTAPLDMLVDTFQAAGLLFGAVVGWWLERRHVGFSVEGTRREKVVRVVVGIALVLAVRYLVAAPIGGFLGEEWAGFLKSALPFAVGMAGIPALFPLIRDRFGQAGPTSR